MITSTRSTAAPLFRVDGLRVAYSRRGKQIVAVDDLSLGVSSGQSVAVVGESGSGKSTTLRALLGLLPRDATVSFGAVSIAGSHTGSLRPVNDPATLRRHVGLVPQDPARALDPLLRIERSFAELYRHFRGITDHEEIRQRAIDDLKAVGVTRPADRLRQYPHELSGGLLQRILIALALVNEPSLLFADEPTSNLDVTAQRQVLDLFDDLRQSRELGLVLVTHDISVVHERSDEVVVMRSGHVIEAGITSEVLTSPRDAYTRTLVDAVPSRLPARSHTPAADPDRTAVLKGTRLFKSFGGTRGMPQTEAVSDISVELHRGQTVGIVGESGAGKSTLLRILAGIERPDAGTVRWHGPTGVTESPGSAGFRRRVSVVYQNPASSLNPAMSIGAIIEDPLRANRIGNSTTRNARARALLTEVGLPEDFVDRRPRQLSGGQLQRVAIARALASEPDVVALDEPVAALDQAVQLGVLKLLIEIQERLGVAYLLISHDLDVVHALADDVLVVRNGRIEETGSVSQVLHRPTADYTRSLLEALPSPIPDVGATDERTTWT